jgi:hypothetical protein
LPPLLLTRNSGFQAENLRMRWRCARLRENQRTGQTGTGERTQRHEKRYVAPARYRPLAENMMVKAMTA